MFVVCTIFVVLGFFVKPIRTFENSHMKKWTMLAEQDRLMTIQRVIPNAEDQDLLMNCITKISNLPNSIIFDKSCFIFSNDCLFFIL